LAQTFTKSAYFFYQAQRFGANIFKVRIFFFIFDFFFLSGAKVWCKHFQSPHIFSSGAKVWRKHFQNPHIFSSSTKVWRKHFSKCAYFSSDANNFKEAPKFSPFPNLPRLFFSFRFNFQRKICKEQKQSFKKQSKAKKQYVFPSSSQKFLCKKNVKSKSFHHQPHIIIILCFQFPPSLPAKTPPTSSLPHGWA
jgi:hypothetical protein